MSQQPLALPNRADQHITSSSRPGIQSAAGAPATAARQQPHCHLAGSPAADVSAAATAEVAMAHRHSSAAASLQPVTQRPDTQNAQDAAECSQPAAARSLRHCSSLHSFADEADAQRPEQSQADSGRNHTAQQLAQRAQHEADSLNAQHVEACVASSRRLEQPTASTGTSRPVPLAHRGERLSLSPCHSCSVRPFSFLTRFLVAQRVRHAACVAIHYPDQDVFLCWEADFPCITRSSSY